MRVLSRLRQQVQIAHAAASYHTNRAVDDRACLEESMAWLARAQDAVRGLGVSCWYSPADGWHPDPYPETSGYILTTFLCFGRWFQRPEFTTRAQQLAHWLVDTQHASGGILSSVKGSELRVFNTGQVLLGWCSFLDTVEAPKIKAAAVRAGRFLVAGQEANGSWVKDTYCGARTYHARVAWSLLRLAALTGQAEFWEAGRRNLVWTLAQRTANGWFNNCGFNQDAPNTHVLGYTLCGLVECHALLAQRDARDPLAHQTLEAAQAMAKGIMQRVDDAHVGLVPGMLPCAFDPHWHPTDPTSCLTGNAQLAICLMRLEHITSRPDCRAAAWALLDGLKPTVKTQHGTPGERGALAGSFPFGDGYMHGRYPNWATKFLADALMMRLGAPAQWKVDA